MKLAVTGAGGFVGGAVCRAAEAAGWTVHPLTRREWDIDNGPLACPPDVDVVVHAAAAVTEWGDPAKVRRTNVDGTRHVLETFPGKRIVHVSTASVYDPFTPTSLATEDQPPVRRYLTAYAETKAEAERLVRDRPDHVILRPHAVYGPGDPTLLPRVLDAVRGRTLLIVGDGRARQSLTSIGNLVQAVLLACGSAATGTFNIADAEPVEVGDALRDILAQRGLRVTVRGLPQGLAWVLAALGEAVYRAAGSRRPPRLTRYAISHLAEERTLDLTAARAHLGYQPAMTSFAGAGRWDERS